MSTNRRIACVRFPSKGTAAPPPGSEARAALAGALLRAAPRITPAAGHPCAFWADAGGMARHGGEPAVARALLSAARRAGAPGARVGVAGTCIAAAAATRERGTALRVVPPGRDGAYLARRTLAVLPLTDSLRHALGLLGLRTCGALAALPPNEVELRFGADGLCAWRLAAGRDGRWPFRPAPPDASFAEVDLDSPVDALEPLRFVLGGLVASVAAAAAARQRIPGSLRLVLRLEDAPDDLRHVRPARPTGDVRVLAELCRRSLEARPPSAPVRGLSLEGGDEAAPRADQLDAFAVPAPDPGALHAALLPVFARWGDGALSRAVRHGAHLPAEHAEWERLGSEGIAPFADAAPAGPPGPPSGEAPAFRNTAPLCLRRLPEPRPVRVRENGSGGPLRVFLSNPFPNGKLESFPPEVWKTRRAGPERISGPWWGAPVARDYWRVEGPAGCLALVYRDCAAGGWYLEGWYD